VTSTILSRLSGSSFQSTVLSSTQSQVDGLVTNFVEEAANPRTLAALTAGGLAYRVGRLGTLALAVNTGERIAPVLRLGSYAIGLGSEVTAFEFSNRSLISLGERAGLNSAPSENLWNWSGVGGWREGLASSAITFGLLKGAGFLGREQNIVFQHAFQSTAMVAGHNAAGFLGVTANPQGTLAEQLLHAEATNLQLGAGTSLLHSMAPGVHALERGLDLSLSAPSSPFSIQRNLALQEASAGGHQETAPRESSSHGLIPHILEMSSNQGDGKGGDDGKSPSRGRGAPPPPPPK
jgi:hypothetical protein